MLTGWNLDITYALYTLQGGVVGCPRLPFWLKMAPMDLCGVCAPLWSLSNKGITMVGSSVMRQTGHSCPL